MNKGTIFNVERCSFVDGPGIRTTVFFKGCNLRCAWCHNPESHLPQPQLMYYEERCTHCGLCREQCPHHLSACTLCGACARICPAEARQLCGRAWTVEEVLELVAADRRFYDTTEGGVTFSGGECMLQLDFLTALLEGCKQQGIHTAVDTAGHLPYASFERIRPYTDLFLYDIKLADPQRHRQYVGVDNRRIVDNLQRLCRDGARVWVRVPIVAGVNDTVEEMQAIRALWEGCPAPERVELLPYHAMGEGKYQALGQTPPAFSAPDQAVMERLQAAMQ